MLEGWRTVVRDELAKDVSFLADVIVDEVLSHDLKLEEHAVRTTHINEILKSLYYRLPADLDRRAIVLRVREALVTEFNLIVRHNGERLNGSKLK